MSAALEESQRAGEQRVREEQSTRRAVALHLDDARTTAFPDHPVIWDGIEVSWRACDIAFTYGRQDGSGEPMMSRWLAALPRARRYVEAEQAEFLRGGDMIPSPEPTRDAQRLPDLREPLVLRTPPR